MSRFEKGYDGSPLRPREPWEHDYEAKVERRYIYSFWESLQEDEDWDDGEEEQEEPEKPIEQVTLAWLLTKLPPGVKPEEVKIEFGYNASSMAYEDHYVKFYYEEQVPARKDEYKAAKKKWKEDMKEWQAEFDEWQATEKAKKIKEMEKELDKLKRDK